MPTFRAILGAALLAFALPACSLASTIYSGVLIGSNEVPPNASTATGSVTLTLSGDSLTVAETFSGLTANPTGAHIHCCVAPGSNATVAVPFTGFPAATSGTYSATFDLTLLATYNPAFVTANGGTAASAEAAFIAGLNSGLTYANIHDANYPGGEIRGQLGSIPEPGTAGLLMLGLLPAIALIRKRKSS